MASGSSGRANSGSKVYDFASSEDILCNYNDFNSQESSNSSHSDPVAGANSVKIEREMTDQEEAEAMLQGQARLWQCMLAYVDTMALKCVKDLRIADIIDAHGGPITLSQIINNLDSPSADISYLERIMRLLVRRKIFAAHPKLDGGETLYGLTQSSKWLLHDADLSLAPMLEFCSPMFMGPWYCFSNCVKEGGNAFEKAYGQEIFAFASNNPRFSNIFNNGMACTAKIVMRAVISEYKGGFDCIGSLVDVGGGTGMAIAEVVKAYPHIKGINFDLPQVIATAPSCSDVTQVGGDMFKDIPCADAIFMKLIMHDWSDEDCVKILKNCRKAIPEKTGKVIIADFVLQPDGNGLFDDMAVVFDLTMIAYSSGGKERTELEWKKLLEEGGFPRYKIVKIPAFLSIIEAHPE